MTYHHIQLVVDDAIATIWLNRPQVRNALDEILIAELMHAFTQLQATPAVRAIVLGGRGSAFCAGADLNWMKRMAGFSRAQNQQDALALAQMLHQVHACSKPVIARVHGPAFAGGMGLAAACDIIVADPAAEFCLTEVRIGLSPSTISPYVIQALGLRAARRYMLTAERLQAPEAYRLGLVQELAQEGMIDEAVTRVVRCLLMAGPLAIAETKALIDDVALRSVDADLISNTALRIATIRASDEGREGVSSFLEKRQPGWLLCAA